MSELPWRHALEQAIVARDRGALTRAPKTDLHCHGLLSAPRAVYERLLGHELPPVPRVFGGFAPFGDYIVSHLLPALSGRGAVRALMRAAFERLVDDGVVYAEMSFDLLIPGFVGAGIDEFAEILREEVARVADRVTVAAEVGISRKLPPGEALPLLRQWISAGGVRSIDLYDDENAGVIDEFVPLYRLAAENGLKLKAHAGEFCGPSRVRESVEKLNLHAVQHGVRAIESPAVVDLLVERGTLLHLCPTSNYSLGVCDSLENHPARRLHERGVRITVNSDDFTLFGVGVSDEILNLTAMGFSPEQIVTVVDNGLRERIPQ